jgi:lactam utilization protein B
MKDDSTDKLEDLADKVAEEFRTYRQPDEFKEISLIVSDRDSSHQTLIVHVDGENAVSLADRVEEFLHQQGAQTQREHHSESDVRVLAIVD